MLLEDGVGHGWALLSWWAQPCGAGYLVVVERMHGLVGPSRWRECGLAGVDGLVYGACGTNVVGS